MCGFDKERTDFGICKECLGKIDKLSEKERRDKMAGRYLITGTQIGMLIAIESKDEREKLLKEIEEKQYVGDSERDILEDIKVIRE
jgi:hypothetical protein